MRISAVILTFNFLFFYILHFPAMYCIFHHFAGLGVSQALYVFSKVERGLSLGGRRRKAFNIPTKVMEVTISDHFR